MSRCRLLAQRGGWRNGHPQDWASRREKSVGFLLVAATAAPTSSAVPTAIRGTPGREAIGAVDGLLAAGLEGYLSLLPALSANRREHLPLTSLVPAAAGIPAATTACLIGSSAAGASARLVGEALLSEELLLSRREDELLVAVAAGEGFVLHVDHADSHLGLYLERSVSAIEFGERSKRMNHQPIAEAS